IKEEGAPFDVHPKYMSFMANNTLSKAKDKQEKKKEESKAEEAKTEEAAENAEEVKKPEDSNRWGSKEIVMSSVTVTDEKGEERDTFLNTEPIHVHIGYENPGKIENSVVGVAIYRDDKVHIYGTNTLIDMSKTLPLKDKGTITLVFDRIPVNAGNYIFDLAFHKPDGFNYDFWRDVFRLKINNVKGEAGTVSIEHSWKSDTD
ncbi:MAG: Wzt carbohydrate-binding domain-containing protein, partial [Lachnospiraceae bacterium]|nr:Wzt carbohydrate-binding domain-containing protein [Lachnospiraceae bacterium]